MDFLSPVIQYCLLSNGSIRLGIIYSVLNEMKQNE